MPRSTDRANRRNRWGPAAEPARSSDQPPRASQRSGKLPGRSRRFRKLRAARWGAAECRWIWEISRGYRPFPQQLPGRIATGFHHGANFSTGLDEAIQCPRQALMAHPAGARFPAPRSRYHPCGSHSNASLGSQARDGAGLSPPLMAARLRRVHSVPKHAEGNAAYRPQDHDQRPNNGFGKGAAAGRFGGMQRFNPHHPCLMPGALRRRAG